MKYIDAEKLIERLEEMKRAEYENCGGVNSKTGALQEVQGLIESLQQEQPEVDLDKEFKDYMETSDGYVLNSAGFTNKKTAYELARHFFDLGLNARKEETK